MTSATRASKAAERAETSQTTLASHTPPIRQIRKVLIANRGEIACRIMRTCRAMGIATVAVYSDADANARHVREADEAVRIGGSAASESYLNIPALLAAAARTGADAVHPGYGFLSENADFAAACRAADLIFIGPQTDVIARMGSKIEAKHVAAAAGVPIVPGYLGDDQSDARFLSEARAAGYPVLVKASAGGGGKGMRSVESESDLPQALAAARREAKSAFGDDTLLLEKLISAPRHVEIQIFGDEHGHVVHLGERECSIQRRHQKVIEETPSTALSAELRERMTRAGVAVGEQLGYSNAGTVEFILDATGNFYFLEVNTRLQVEHAVTELVTGLDLVRWQIRVAEGYSLPLSQAEIRFVGHAVEARLYAEVPALDFLPASGDIALWREPSNDDGVRVDSGVASGDTISSYYDPLIAKMVAHGEDRPEALQRLERALSKTLLFGISTNRDFLRRLLLQPDHLAGRIDTGFIERHRAYLIDPASSAQEKAAITERASTAALLVAIRRLNRANEHGHWRNNLSRPVLEGFNLIGVGSDPAEEDIPRMDVRLVPVSATRVEATCVVGGVESTHVVELRAEHGDDLDVELDGRRFSATLAETSDDHWWVALGGEIVTLRRRSPFPAPSFGVPAIVGVGERGRSDAQGAAQPGMLLAPLPGQVAAVLVSVGQSVKRGEPLIVLEAMKMEHSVRASRDGEIVAIFVGVGDQARHGAPLLEIGLNGAKEVSV